MSDITSDKPRIILGIDPGTNLLGYGILEVNAKEMKMLGIGVVRLDKLEDHGQKLLHIWERVTALIEGFEATEVAIEAPFYGKNVQSMLKLGRAQGVAIAAALSKGLQVYEYVPRKIKQSITGSGNATKEQVSSMLQSLLKMDSKPETLDASDGMAAAVCHYFQFNPRIFGTSKKAGKSGWSQFVKDNPDKLK